MEDEEDDTYQLDYEPKYSHITYNEDTLPANRNNFTFDYSNNEPIKGTLSLSDAKIALKTLKSYSIQKRITNNSLNGFETILNKINERK